MRKIIYSLIAGVVLLLNSCKIGDAYDYDNDYVRPGYIAFEGVFMAFNKDMGNVSFVLAANDYILGDNAKREEMQQGVFRDVNISQSADRWTFDYAYGGDKEIIRYVMETNGRNLVEKGALWTVTKSNNTSKEKTDSEGKFKIKCTDTDSWELNIEWFHYFNWNKEGNNNGYINTAETVFNIKRTSFTENGGYQSAAYTVNGSAVYKSGNERDFLIESTVNGANITVWSEAGFYPFARKKTESANFQLTIENRDRRTDNVTAVVSGNEVSVNYNKHRRIYQVPDFTGIPKPSKPVVSTPQPEPNGETQ